MLQLAKLRSGELAHRQMVLEEKLEKVEEVQATVEELKEKQESLRQELEQIRALQPKVCSGMFLFVMCLCFLLIYLVFRSFE